MSILTGPDLTSRTLSYLQPAEKLNYLTTAAEIEKGLFEIVERSIPDIFDITSIESIYRIDLSSLRQALVGSGSNKEDQSNSKPLTFLYLVSKVYHFKKNEESAQSNVNYTTLEKEILKELIASKGALPNFDTFFKRAFDCEDQAALKLLLLMPKSKELTGLYLCHAVLEKKRELIALFLSDLASQNLNLVGPYSLQHAINVAVKMKDLNAFKHLLVSERAHEIPEAGLKGLGKLLVESIEGGEHDWVEAILNSPAGKYIPLLGENSMQQAILFAIGDRDMKTFKLLLENERVSEIPGEVLGGLGWNLMESIQQRNHDWVKAILNSPAARKFPLRGKNSMQQAIFFAIGNRDMKTFKLLLENERAREIPGEKLSGLGSSLIESIRAEKHDWVEAILNSFASKNIPLKGDHGLTRAIQLIISRFTINDIELIHELFCFIIKHHKESDLENILDEINLEKSPLRKYPEFFKCLKDASSHMKELIPLVNRLS